MKTLVMLIAVVGLALSAGCSKDAAESPASDTETAAPAQARSAEPDEGADDIVIADSELPVAADFEEEADSEINTDNYASVLDELEGEISSE